MQVKNHIEHYKIDAELFNYFSENNKLENDYNIRIHESIITKIPGQDLNILDIGSGGGWIKNKLSDKNITLVDLSYKNLSIIKNNDQNRPGFYLVADAHGLPFKDESFDIIIISEVLEHLNNPGLAISNAFRVLKKGGKIIITTPYNEIIRYYLCIHCNQKTPANAHLHSFNEEILSDILKKANISSFEFYKMGNRHFLKFRISYILKYFPFFIWKLIDKMFIFLLRSPLTLILTINK
jgi:ubiquinone/menaquinone biosynthesis C-methylase UbiE